MVAMLTDAVIQTQAEKNWQKVTKSIWKKYGVCRRPSTAIFNSSYCNNMVTKTMGVFS